jgi:hypothetical protein
VPDPEPLMVLLREHLHMTMPQAKCTTAALHYTCLRIVSGRRQCTATDIAQYVTTARASIRQAPAFVNSAPVSAHAAVRFDLKAGAT